MKTISKAIAITLSTALISTSLLPVTSAHAHDKRKWHKHSHHKPIRHHRYKRSSKGDKIAAGIIGFAIGAIIASEASKRHRQPVYQPSYNKPRPIYRERIYDDRNYVEPNYDTRVERRPIDNYDTDQPRVITYNDEVATTSYEPWSQGWANYCKNKYRSFNASTGTFRGYDGKNHFCVVK